jgi:hypothetical protein
VFRATVERKPIAQQYYKNTTDMIGLSVYLRVISPMILQDSSSCYIGAHK